MSQENYYIGSDKIWLSLENVTPISMRRLTFGVARVRKRGRLTSAVYQRKF